MDPWQLDVWHWEQKVSGILTWFLNYQPLIIINYFPQSNLTEQGSGCPAVQLFMTDELEEIKRSVEGKGTVIPQEWVYLQALILSITCRVKWVADSEWDWSRFIWQSIQSCLEGDYCCSERSTDSREWKSAGKWIVCVQVKHHDNNSICDINMC